MKSCWSWDCHDNEYNEIRYKSILKIFYTRLVIISLDFNLIIALDLWLFQSRCPNRQCSQVVSFLATFFLILLISILEHFLSSSSSSCRRMLWNQIILLRNHAKSNGILWNPETSYKIMCDHVKNYEMFYKYMKSYAILRHHGKSNENIRNHMNS